MAEYGLIGVYPISEDIQPGDVLLDLMPAGNSVVQPSIQRLGSLPVPQLVQALQAQEARRLVFGTRPARDKPPTTTTSTPAPGISVSAPAGSNLQVQVRPTPAPASPRTPNPRPATTPAPDPNDDATPQVLYQTERTPYGRTARLRAAEIPGFAIGRVSRVDTGVAAFFQGIGATLGLSYRTASAVSLSLEGIEVAGLDSVSALEMLDSQRIAWVAQNRLTPHRLLRMVNLSNPVLAQRVCLNEDRNERDEGLASIHVVNRVYYARKINYQLLEQSEFASQLAARVGQNVLPAATTRPQSVATAVGIDLGTLMSNVDQRVSGARDAAAAAVPGGEGGSLSVGLGTFGNLSLNRDLRVPMAVGFNSVETYPLRAVLMFTVYTPDPPPVRARRDEVAERNEAADRALADEYNQQNFLALLRHQCALILSGHHRQHEFSSERVTPSPIERLVCANTNTLAQTVPQRVRPSLRVGICADFVDDLRSGSPTATRPSVFDRRDLLPPGQSRRARTVS